MITIRTKNFVFHVFTEPCPYQVRATVELLKQYEQSHVIYFWSPAGLRKFFCDRYGWFPQVHDIKSKLKELYESDNVALSDLYRSLYHSPMCFRARFFSGHVRSPIPATTHRAIVVSIIHEGATKLIHDSLMAERTQE